MSSVSPVAPTGIPVHSLQPQRRSPTSYASVLIAPAGMLIGLVLLCAAAVLRISFGSKNAEWIAWTVESWIALFEPIYLRVFAKTLGLAAASSILAVVVAFPVAVYMARTRSAALRRTVLICVMLPMLVSLLVQSYGWIVILGPNGILNSVFSRLVDMTEPISLLFNDTGVLLGLVQTSLPLAVLPIASALRTISPEVEEAASVLGASRPAVYRTIILPLAWPGIVAGGLLVFAFNAGAFAVPLLIGGLKVTTAALLIRDEMGTLLNWPFGSVLSVVLMLITMAILFARRMLVSGRGQGR
ncbi:ABC transporter permease [Mesorhizobium sp.]|uniref:ABC transporter permease n=1 Tax=Mesorhizobium sp. TaxID=1871066 RepID=UPI00122B07B5|nr:ABC transporter permease [Mesorhizobium sp.]TIS86010.1 MAG: ABC transporter permease [Mesorhizobium sp.]